MPTVSRPDPDDDLEPVVVVHAEPPVEYHIPAPPAARPDGDCRPDPFLDLDRPSGIVGPAFGGWFFVTDNFGDLVHMPSRFTTSGSAVHGFDDRRHELRTLEGH